MSELKHKPDMEIMENIEFQLRYSKRQLKKARAFILKFGLDYKIIKNQLNQSIIRISMTGLPNQVHHDWQYLLDKPYRVVKQWMEIKEAYQNNLYHPLLTFKTYIGPAPEFKIKKAYFCPEKFKAITHIKDLADVIEECKKYDRLGILYKDISFIPAGVKISELEKICEFALSQLLNGGYTSLLFDDVGKRYSISQFKLYPIPPEQEKTKTQPQYNHKLIDFLNKSSSIQLIAYLFYLKSENKLPKGITEIPGTVSMQTYKDDIDTTIKFLKQGIFNIKVFKSKYQINEGIKTIQRIIKENIC